jgi:hypothetical protein
MIKFVRPFLQRIGELHPSKENLSKQPNIRNSFKYKGINSINNP